MNTRWLFDINNVVIRDQAGIPRRLSIFSSRFGFRKLPHELPMSARSGVYREMRRRYVLPTALYSTFVLTPVCLVVSFLVVFSLMALGVDDVVPGVWGAAVVFGVYMGFSWIVIELIGLPVVRRWYRRCYTDAMLGHGLCPWCGYGLRGLPEDAQANVRCPECTGRWPSPESHDRATTATGV